MTDHRKTGPAFYEFFCGGGMARLGLGPGWRCLWANDWSAKKTAAYRANFPAEHLVEADLNRVGPDDLPGRADLAWASFPCQDLSLAGAGRGLKGERSGTFWAFHAILGRLADQGRAPRLAVIENVVGTLSSRQGRDFEAIFKALIDLGYRVGPVVIDAAWFLPQSRPRLFICAAVDPKDRAVSGPTAPWHPKAVVRAYDRLPKRLNQNWVWWRLPNPPERKQDLIDIIEADPTGVKLNSPAQTDRLLSLMSERHRARVTAAQASGKMMVGAVYKRTRRDKAGKSVQRAEVRFDGLSGCLRTPAGGSSRQTIMIIQGDRVVSRLLSAREAARLMGLPDNYRLPDNYNAAYHLAGDGLVVPAVGFLAENLLKYLI